MGVRNLLLLALTTHVRNSDLINLFGIGGVGVMQNITARVFDAKITESQAAIISYNAVILVFCVTLLLGLIIYIFSQDRTD